MITRLLLAVTLSLVVAPLGAAAQAPVLLHDVEPGPTDSLPRNFTVAGEHMYFSAGINGVWNLWQTDGTPEGTRQVPGGEGLTVLGPFDEQTLVVGTSQEATDWSLLSDGDPPALRPLDVADPGGHPRGARWFEVAGRRLVVEERAAHRDKDPPLSLLLREVTPEGVVTLIDTRVGTDGRGGFMGPTWLEGDVIVVQTSEDPCATLRLTVDPPAFARADIDPCPRGLPVPVGDDQIALVGRRVVLWQGGDPNAEVVLAESGSALLGGEGGAWFNSTPNSLWWTDGTVAGTVRLAEVIYSNGGRLRRGGDLLFVTHNGQTPDAIVLHRPGVGVATVLDVGSRAASVTLPGRLHAFGDALVFSARAPGVGSEPHALPELPDSMFEAPDAGPADGGVPDVGVPDAGGPDAGGPDAGGPDSGEITDLGVEDGDMPDADDPADADAQDDGDGASGGCAVSTPRSTGHPLLLPVLLVLCVSVRRWRLARASRGRGGR